MRRASPAARPRQARKATGPGGEICVKGYPHLGGQGGVLRLRGTGLCPQWAGAPPATTLGGVCSREARNQAQLGVEKSPGRDRALGGGTDGKQEAVTPVTELSARGA